MATTFHVIGNDIIYLLGQFPEDYSLVVHQSGAQDGIFHFTIGAMDISTLFLLIGYLNIYIIMTYAFINMVLDDCAADCFDHH